jgi:SAM-dependent methyltransferase
MTFVTLQSHVERLLCCPTTHQDLRLLRAEEIESLNQRIAGGEMVHVDHSPVRQPISAGLITADERLIYPILDEILCFLPEHAIALTAERDDSTARAYAESAKDSVRDSVKDYYEAEGWAQTDEGHTEDAVRFEDLRPVSQEYIHRTRMRVKDRLPPQGTYFLDAGSGPIQYPEYLTYSEDYDLRVCVDITLAALRGAQRKVPAGRGLFVLASIPNLPFKSGVFDAITSIHVIYHIEQQRPAIEELYRVLKPGGKGVIVYAWPPHLPVKLLAAIPFMALRWWRRARRALRRILPGSAPSGKKTRKPAGFYYSPHPRSWFLQGWDFEFDICAWRSVGTPMLKNLIHPRLGGKALLRVMFALESRFPHFFGRFGHYPMLVFGKLA